MQQRKRGFTLIEIMVVVVIIGLLAAFVGPEIWQMFARGQEDIAATKCQEIHGKVKYWMTISKKGVPSDLRELEAPISKGEEGPFYEIQDDPWGNPYRIEPSGRRSFRIVCDGPDGEPGTDDDIGYPENDRE